MQNCREVTYLIARDGLEHADWSMRLRTRLHLLYCKHCRRYATEFTMIGRIGREVFSADSVDPKTLQRLEGSIMDYALGGHEEGQEKRVSRRRRAAPLVVRPWIKNRALDQGVLVGDLPTGLLGDFLTAPSLRHR